MQYRIEDYVMTVLIETPRLIMRHFTLDDANDVLQFNSNERVTRYTGDAGFCDTLEASTKVIKKLWLKEYETYGYARYALIHKEHNKLIGFCGIKYETQIERPDIGYRMLPEYWGQGLGFEAAQATLEHATNDLGLTYLIGEVDENNDASHRILNKLGFNEIKRYQYESHPLIQLEYDRFPTIESKRLCFIEQTKQYIDDVYALFSHPKTCAFYDLSTFSTLEQAAELIEQDDLARRQGKGVRWLLKMKDSNKVIGSCGYKYDYKDRSARISYEIHPDYWQLGFAQEAVSTMIAWMFGSIKSLNRIEAYVMPENLASTKLLKKIGFELEGLLREKGVWKNEYHDLTIFAKLRPKNI